MIEFGKDVADGLVGGGDGLGYFLRMIEYNYGYAGNGASHGGDLFTLDESGVMTIQGNTKYQHGSFPDPLTNEIGNAGIHIVAPYSTNYAWLSLSNAQAETDWKLILDNNNALSIWHFDWKNNGPAKVTFIWTNNWMTVTGVTMDTNTIYVYNCPYIVTNVTLVWNSVKNCYQNTSPYGNGDIGAAYNAGDYTDQWCVTNAQHHSVSGSDDVCACVGADTPSPAIISPVNTWKDATAFTNIPAMFTTGTTNNNLNFVGSFTGNGSGMTNLPTYDKPLQRVLLGTPIFPTTNAQPLPFSGSLGWGFYIGTNTAVTWAIDPQPFILTLQGGYPQYTNLYADVWIVITNSGATTAGVTNSYRLSIVTNKAGGGSYGGVWSVISNLTFTVASSGNTNPIECPCKFTPPLYILSNNAGMTLTISNCSATATPTNEWILQRSAFTNATQ